MPWFWVYASRDFDRLQLRNRRNREIWKGKARQPVGSGSAGVAADAYDADARIRHRDGSGRRGPEAAARSGPEGVGPRCRGVRAAAPPCLDRKRFPAAAPAARGRDCLRAARRRFVSRLVARHAGRQRTGTDPAILRRRREVHAAAHLLEWQRLRPSGAALPQHGARPVGSALLGHGRGRPGFPLQQLHQPLPHHGTST